MGDRGQAAIAVVLIASALFGATMLGAYELGDRVVDRRRAQSVADAVALAGAADGPAAAQDVAIANGATLTTYGRAGEAVTVVVTVDSVSATARASATP